MDLKKINKKLQQSLIEANLIEANELQRETYSIIKSGIDLVIESDIDSGKSTTIALHVIQRLDKQHLFSPRALIICDTKEKVLELVEVFDFLNKYNQLRVFHLHDKSDIDYNKNLISLGIDVLIGTPTILIEMFASAGFDVNQLQLFILDDVDLLCKNRYEPKIKRLADSLHKGQKLFFCTSITEKVEALAFNLMEDPEFIPS